MPAPTNGTAHGGGYIPNESQASRYPNSHVQSSDRTLSAHGGGFVPSGKTYCSGSAGTAHGGGFVPNQPLGSNRHGSPEPPQMVRRYAPTSYGKVSVPGQTQVYYDQSYTPMAHTNQVEVGYATKSYTAETVREGHATAQTVQNGYIPTPTQQVNLQ